MTWLQLMLLYVVRRTQRTGAKLVITTTVVVIGILVLRRMLLGFTGKCCHSPALLPFGFGHQNSA